MAVDRCVCHSVPLAELKRLADADASLRTVDALSARTRCCTGCGMCEPYVRLMLRTGQTSFPVLSEGQIERLLAERGEADRAGPVRTKTARESPGRG